MGDYQFWAAGAATEAASVGSKRLSWAPPQQRGSQCGSQESVVDLSQDIMSPCSSRPFPLLFIFEKF